MSKDLNPEDFRAPEDEPSTPTKSRLAHKSRYEIKHYQFPAAVVETLIQIDYAPAWRLVAAVYKAWYRDFKKRNPVRLTSDALTGFRISKDQKSRALKILEQTDHFLVERFPRRNPFVMMRWKLTKD
jgi:hypothetical protein